MKYHCMYLLLKWKRTGGALLPVLTQLIVSGSLTVEAERVISDLLYELVGYYAETLKAPRWLRTKEGSIELLD